jgi:predicted component of type VI protein secretion system
VTQTDLSDTLRLAWLVDEHWGKAYPIGDRVTIGRGPENKVILRDSQVSRVHAEVLREEDHFILRSLGASGTTVNGVQAQATHRLKDGDLIEIAFSVLRFQTKAPESDLLVVARDMPTPVDDQEAPTAASMRAANRSSVPAVGHRYWQWLRRWLTRRPKTD